MSRIDRRHRGRAIRKARRRNGMTAGVAFVSISMDLRGFSREIERLARVFARFSHAYRHPRPILHNGRKARR